MTRILAGRQSGSPLLNPRTIQLPGTDDLGQQGAELLIGSLVLVDLDDRLRPCEADVRHVFLLPHLCVTSQEDEGCTVDQKDGH
jgi:hypothetical protein